MGLNVTKLLLALVYSYLSILEIRRIYGERKNNWKRVFLFESGIDEKNNAGCNSKKGGDGSM